MDYHAGSTPHASKLRLTASAVLLAALGALLADSASAGLLFNRSRGADAAAVAGFPAKGDPSTAQSRTINVGGSARTYLVQPAGGRASAPIVVMLHGGTETSEQFWSQTSLPTLGAQNGFIVVAPQGLNKHWNDGRGAVLGGKGSTADDVGFLRAVINQVVQQDHGDPKAVFMVGPSNGGFMTQYFACQASDMLRAGANLISDLPTDTQRNCKAAKPLPWLSINGTADPLIPFEGQGAGVVKNGEPQPAMLSADETFSFWAGRAGCSEQAATERIGGSGETYTEKRTRSCAGGTKSVQYVVHGAGHTLPGMQVKSALIRHFIGEPSLDIDAGTVIWDFFKSTLQGS